MHEQTTSPQTARSLTAIQGWVEWGGEMPGLCRRFPGLEHQVLWAVSVQLLPHHSEACSVTWAHRTGIKEENDVVPITLSTGGGEPDLETHAHALEGMGGKKDKEWS